ncbi:hypothetical protein B7C51_17945 [Paenibacillus larvae subsp. pulvifaciens]|uniref:Uncharacterized protein n=1 Tax=Paenibacillus larvae subsp. pulvifaciens TaxID=1477 RepID=A0A1V0UVR1_9BACL|nr:hypothetical protein [Paenibacillus larvae]ARF69295.1 hypothetical protein B7C51_17945 [Paenibacillus larvae subsp. pulvifaciens]
MSGRAKPLIFQALSGLIGMKGKRKEEMQISNKSNNKNVLAYLPNMNVINFTVFCVINDL